MKYTIRESEAFSVVGQKVELTNSQRKNVQISTGFWRTFNQNLKKAYLSQYGNWTKYAFMEKSDGKLFYYCSIPKRAVIPEGFSVKEIKTCRYLVVEHVGSMNEIYNSYSELYREVLPSTGYMPLQEDFLHFEKYDYRFHWNRENSIIEIWLPIKG
ncbi:MAG TPA: GyrI-like domain-containing protein [Lachnospiraceae bacterium]|nr:GyrI-like domain-containing protein [Lachnospiraceae bacterium]